MKSDTNDDDCPPIEGKGKGVFRKGRERFQHSKRDFTTRTLSLKSDGRDSLV